MWVSNKIRKTSVSLRRMPELISGLVNIIHHSVQTKSSNPFSVMGREFIYEIKCTPFELQFSGTQEEDEWLDWKSVQEMIESWIGLRQEMVL